MRAVGDLIARYRNLRLVLLAGLVSQVGDWMLIVGVVYHVYAMTRSTAASATLVFAALTPQVLLAPIAGVFADRWDRRRVMVATNVLMALALAPLLLVHRAGQVWLVFAVVFVVNSLATAFAPAEQALMPQLVEDADLVSANALYGQNQSIARLVGSGLGGVAAAGGIVAVALSDAASFVVAASLIAALPAGVGRGSASREPAGLRSRLATLGEEFAEGIYWVRRQPVVRALVWFTLLTSTGEGVVGTLFAPFVRGVLHGTSAAYGVVIASQALGGIVGGLLAAAFGSRVPAVRMFTWGAIAFGAIDLAIFTFPLVYVAVWPAVLGMTLVGLPAALMMAGFMTLFQRHTEDHSRGRVYSTVFAASGVSGLVGVAGAGVLQPALGIVPVIAFQGAAYLLAGLGVRIALLRSPEAVASPPLQAPLGAPE